MNHYDSDLILLLRLNEGHLTGGDAEEVRERLAVEPQLKLRWDRLRQVIVSGPYPPGAEASFESSRATSEDLDEDSAETPSSQHHSRLDRIRQPGMPSWPISAETIAAFAEGSLPPKEAIQIETRIWESPRLIYEVGEAFRFRCQPPEPRASHPELTSRLLALGEDFASTPATNTSDESVSRVDITPVNGQASLDRLNGQEQSALAASLEQALDPIGAEDPVEDRSITVATVGAGKANGVARADAIAAGVQPTVRRRSVIIKVLAVGVLGLLGCVVSIASYRLIRSPEVVIEDDGSGESGNAQPSHNDRPNGVRERDLLTQDGERGFQGSESETQSGDSTDEGSDRERDATDSLVDTVPRFPEPSQDHGTVAQSETTSPATVEIDLESGPNRTPLKENDEMLAESELIAMQWQRVEGLLAVRDDISGSWMGASAKRPALLPTSFATLPGSWASAQTEGFGEVVMDEDTEAQFRRFNRRNLSVRIEFGSVAFKDVPSDTVIRLLYPAGRSVIRVLADGTEFGVQIAQQESLVVVRRGSVRVGNRELSRGQQLGLASLRVVDAESKSDLRWFDRPTKTHRVPRRVVDRLLVSDRLTEELKTLRESNNASIREAGVHWGVSLEPDTSFVDLLVSRDLSIRDDAFRWLVGQPPHSESLRQALASLARRTGDPSAVRMLYRWSTLARAGSAVPRADAVAMLRILNHDELAIRVAAFRFLRLAFGKAIVFDVEGRLIERRAQANRLEQMINRVYESRRNNQPSPRQRTQINSRPNGQRQTGQTSNRGRR